MNIVSNSNELNLHQKQAVILIDGPLLVLAGAGTGKTKVLTNRFAYIIEINKALPENILAVTFTNKSAQEMRERIKNIINLDTSLLWIGTFHSICLKIIKRHLDNLPINKFFTIIDKSDQKKIVKKILEKFNIDSKLCNYVIEKIDNTKNKGNKIKEDYYLNNISGSVIFENYQQLLIDMNVCDFNDLILHCINLWEQNPLILDSYQEQFKYIMVDEYQDTNPIQYRWLSLLAKKYNNICCVGDEDQTIYSWRGADIGNILNFEKDFHNAKTIFLEENYRSTEAILDVANCIINKNNQRLGKKLFSQKIDPTKVSIINIFNEKAEASFVANSIHRLKYSGHPLSDIAILVRAAFQIGALEEAFFHHRISYQIIGGIKFYEHKEIKDLIAYLRLIYNNNSDLYLERVINIPRRGIGNITISKIEQFAQENKISMFNAIKNMINNQHLSGKICKTLAEFISIIEFYNKHQNMPLSELLQSIISDTDYISKELDKDDKYTDRINNINELSQIISSYNNLEEFLNHISLMTDIDDIKSNDCVKIMTIHAAKGLEFKSVFLIGWEEGIIPYKQFDNNNVENLEEERRLAYVALTRAKEQCFISYCRRRTIFNQTNQCCISQFLLKLNPESITFNKI